MLKTVIITKYPLIELIACFITRKSPNYTRKMDQITRKTTILAGHYAYRDLTKHVKKSGISY